MLQILVIQDKEKKLVEKKVFSARCYVESYVLEKYHHSDWRIEKEVYKNRKGELAIAQVHYVTI